MRVAITAFAISLHLSVPPLPGLPVRCARSLRRLGGGVRSHGNLKLGNRLCSLHLAADRQHADRYVAHSIGHRLYQQRQDRSAPEHGARQHLYGCSEVGRDDRHGARAQG
jgi:hypothetical protein